MQSDYIISKKLRRDQKKLNNSIPPESHLSSEILCLLRSYYYNLNTLPDTNDIYQNMKTMWFIRLLQNDMVLSLWKFIDKDSRSLSFEHARKRGSKRSKRIISDEEISKKIKVYRKLVKDTITPKRTSYVAHLEKRDRSHLKPTHFKPIIRLAVEIVDDLNGKEVGYKLESIDLRESLL